MIESHEPPASRVHLLEQEINIHLLSIPFLLQDSVTTEIYSAQEENKQELKLLHMTSTPPLKVDNGCNTEYFKLKKFQS